MKYQRIVLKLSGEALKLRGDGASTIVVNQALLSKIADDVATIVNASVAVGIVLGGGNWFRGVQAHSLGMRRVHADQLGMLATVMNALVLRDTLMNKGLDVSILSAVSIPQMVETFEVTKANAYLNRRKVVVFAGGTGNPFVSTDSAASLRALEVGADILLKATTVDGVYSADPRKHKDAKRHNYLSYAQVLQEELAVMDLSAFIQCRDYKLPIRVFDVYAPHSLVEVVQGKDVGTLIGE